MATIKSFSDLQQSKKLAEFLPLESADMGWNVFVDDSTRILPIDDWDLTKDGSSGVKFFHAWSLAALLSVLPDYTLQDNPDGTVFVVSEKKKPIMSDDYDNPVDACVAMIEKLHELKKL